MSDLPITDPEIDDLIEAIARGDRYAEAGPLPAQVTAYDPATQTCDAQPLVLVPGPDGLSAAPIARQVQVVWPSGATWSLVGPMAVGDLVWLVPCGADIGPWKASGAVMSPSATRRRMDPSDVVAIPGGRPLTTPLLSASYDATAAVLAGSQVKLGDSTATDFVALKSLVETALSALYSEIAGHGHPAPGGATTGYTPPAANPINPLTWPPNTGATKVLAI